MGETADPRDMKRRPLRALCLPLPLSLSAWVCSTFSTSRCTVHTSVLPPLPLLSPLLGEVRSFLIAQHLLFPSSLFVAFGGRPSGQALINFLLNGLKGAERCLARGSGGEATVSATPHQFGVPFLWLCRCRYDWMPLQVEQMRRESGNGHWRASWTGSWQSERERGGRE